MPSADLINIFRKNQLAVSRQLFDQHFSKLAAVAQRLAKSKEQADEMFTVAFHKAVSRIQNPQDTEAAPAIERAFLEECVAFIKSFRSEYFVSSTVHANDRTSKNYDLFEASEPVDYNNIDPQILIGALQQLVPAQRLVFNLHVIDGLSLDATAELLEASEPTVKSNLEKARFNLQKNIDKSYKQLKA